MRSHAFTETDPSDGRVLILPFVWPYSTPQAWINKVKQAQANVTAELQAVESQEARHDIIMQSLEKLGAPHYMEKMHLSASAIQNCEYYNQQVKKPQRKLNFKKIQERGFHGCKFSAYKDEDVMSADDVLRTIGMAVHYIDALQTNKKNKTAARSSTS